MIKISEIIYAGGACPYQLEAITSEGKWLYLRYRGGMLRYALKESAADFGKPNEPWYDFAKKIGDDLDGYADHDVIYPYLKDHIEFPEGFKIQSY